MVTGGDTDTTVAQRRVWQRLFQVWRVWLSTLSTMMHRCLQKLAPLWQHLITLFYYLYPHSELFFESFENGEVRWVACSPVSCWVGVGGGNLKWSKDASSLSFECQKVKRKQGSCLVRKQDNEPDFHPKISFLRRRHKGHNSHLQQERDFTRSSRETERT